MSDGWLRLVMEHSSDLIYLSDLEGGIVHASPSVVRLFGHLPAFQSEGVHPEDLERWRTWWQGVVIDAREERLPCRWQVAAGGWRSFELNGMRVPHEGEPHILT